MNIDDNNDLHTSYDLFTNQNLIKETPLQVLNIHTFHFQDRCPLRCVRDIQIYEILSDLFVLPVKAFGQSFNGFVY